MLRRARLDRPTVRPHAEANPATLEKVVGSAPYAAANARRLRYSRSPSGLRPSSSGDGSGARGRTITVTSTVSPSGTGPSRRAPGAGPRSLPASFVCVWPLLVLLALLAMLLEAVLLEPVLLEAMLLEAMLLEEMLLDGPLVTARVIVTHV